MIRKVILSLFLSLFIFSCSDITEMKTAMKQLGEQQNLIVQKLNAIDKKVGNISKPTPPKKDDKPKADPNKVYDIAEAGSVVLGNTNASVTIIKWTDFQ
tara:strand:- start:176 stop:472 length:297 start_codon:yes stop_codon:yes gene_type:complete